MADSGNSLPRRSSRRMLLDGATGLLDSWGILPTKLTLGRSESEFDISAERRQVYQNAKRFLDALNLAPVMPWLSRRRLTALLETALYRYDQLEEWEQVHAPQAKLDSFSPLIIASHPRSGSTFLQDLLLQDSRSRGLMPWELMTPFPDHETWGTERDQRIKHYQRDAEVATRNNPDLEQLHRFSGGHECWPLLFTGFISHTPFIFFNLGHKYAQWLKSLPEIDRTLGYQLYRRQLHMLQILDPGEFWVLKSPDHLQNLDVVTKVFPHAKIVVLRRNPAQVVTSCSGIAWHLQYSNRRDIDPRQLGREVVAAYTSWAEQYRIFQSNGIIDNPNIIEIDYCALVDRPMECVRQIYALRGCEPDDGTIGAMENWLNNRHWHNRPAIRYDKEIFGLRAEELELLGDA